MVEELLEHFREIREAPWKPLGTIPAVSLAVVFLVVLLVEGMSREGWVPLLDGVNLVFHEAGHPIFGIFGSFNLAYLGGTLMQLLVPLAVLGSFWMKRQTAGAAFAGFWFFQNFLNIARYMADARAQLLPLVGGGEHDWETLFGHWGLLHRDTAIAGTVRSLGWIGMLACAAWLAWQWYRSRGVQEEEA